MAGGWAGDGKRMPDSGQALLAQWGLLGSLDLGVLILSLSFFVDGDESPAGPSRAGLGGEHCGCCSPPPMCVSWGSDPVGPFLSNCRGF